MLAQGMVHVSTFCTLIFLLPHFPTNKPDHNALFRRLKKLNARDIPLALYRPFNLACRCLSRLLIPHSRLFTRRVPHPELLSSRFRISSFLSQPASVPNLGKSRFPGCSQPRIPYCILVKSRDPLIEIDTLSDPFLH